MNCLRPITTLFISLLFSGLTFGQDFENFTTLQSNGSMPAEFLELTSDKYQKDFDENQDESLDEEFFLNTRFFIDDLLLSGKVLFNETCSDYVDRVANYVLRSERKLTKELRFYVLKSNVVNAFSTDQGIIMITTGLLAHLENEAQLASIIAHEVSHYIEDHVRESYVERQSSSKGTGKYSRLDYESKIAKLSRYSKDNELEADSKGIELYLRTEYSIDGIFGALGALLYSYLPFEDRGLDTAIFNTDVLKIPGSKLSADVQPIIKEEDYDDSESTHPNIKKRMDAAFDALGDRKSKGNKKFVISEDEFYKVRDLARFEEINLMLSERAYGKAIYSIQILREDYPDNKFLDVSFGKALYGLAKYKNAGRYSEVSVDYEDSEGEISVLHEFLENVSKEELNVIAYRHVYDVSKKYRDDILDSYEEDMLNDLARRSSLKTNDLQAYDFDGYVDQINNGPTFDIEDSISRVDKSEELSKYEKIKLKKKLRKMQVDDEDILEFENDYYLFGLSDLVRDKNLKEKLKSIKDSGDDVVYDYRTKSRQRRHGYSMGIDKIVIVDPRIENYDIHKKLKHLKSEDAKLNLAEVYTKDYRKITMERSILDSRQLTKSDVEKYNNIGTLFQWVMELLEHEDLENMICSQSDRMQELVKLYGTPHFLFTGIHNSKKRSLFWYTNNTEIVAFSVNAKDDELEFVHATEAKFRPKGKILEAYVHNILYQLNRKPKE